MLKGGGGGGERESCSGTINMIKIKVIVTFIMNYKDMIDIWTANNQMEAASKNDISKI